MGKELETISNIIDQCSKDELTSIFSPIANLSGTSTKAGMISHCLNTGLEAYGFTSYTSPDKSMVLINDESMSQVISFFSEQGYQPYFTKDQIDRIRTIQKVTNDNTINIFWAQSGFRKKYYSL